MDRETQGAWIIHHGRKVASDTRGATEYSAIDLAAKAAALLARMAESKEARLSQSEVVAAARIGGLNPKTELQACLRQLQDRRVVDVGSDETVAVLGVSGRTALGHAADLFEENEPQPFERAAVGLAELASETPVNATAAAEYVSDIYKLSSADTADFLQQAWEIGFVDAEGEGTDRLLFNGNLFRRDTAAKTKKVLDALTQAEQAKMVEFDQMVSRLGCVMLSVAERVLGANLLSKLRAAALYDMNVVSNEAGEHVFVTAPGAFHKFVNPMVDDAFDHAKALVSGLSYGMSLSPTERGRLFAVGALLRKLLRDEEVGPAPAIGYDYRALEFDRVVKIIPTGNNYFKMRLLKREVGELALQVLEGGNASAASLENLPGAGMKGYTPPEVDRTQYRRKTQGAASKAQTRTLLSAVRGGGKL
ncbi:hypothetical protein ACN2C7_02175 [Caulobacter sp. ErkDOM-E]|uniref:hypothetical protein n=1 Tax=Caulobacter sp. ErkDOM-E TaxID=3402778 RepID=UPI003AF5C825